MVEGRISFKWNNHSSTFFSVLSKLRTKETYTDVTLACEGKFFPVHKLVMSTCSDYFSEVFENTPCKSPVIILKDIGPNYLEALLDYMYLGEAEVSQSDLAELLRAAECLKIKGLAVPDEEEPIFTQTSAKGDKNSEAPTPSPPPKRFKKELRESQPTNNELLTTTVDEKISKLPNSDTNLKIEDDTSYSLLATESPSPFKGSINFPETKKDSIAEKLNRVKRKIRVQNPRKIKLAQPVKLVRYPRRKTTAGKLGKQIESSKNKAHNHKTFFFKHEELNTEQETPPVPKPADISEKLVTISRLKLFRKKNLESQNTDHNLNKAGPSGLPLSRKKGSGSERNLSMSEQFCNKVGLPDFSTATMPYLNGENMPGDKKKLAENALIEDLIAHLNRCEIHSFTKNGQVIGKIYLVMQEMIVASFPSILREETNQKRGKKGPLSYIMNKVATRMCSRRRIERIKNLTTSKKLEGSEAPPMAESVAKELEGLEGTEANAIVRKKTSKKKCPAATASPKIDCQNPTKSSRKRDAVPRVTENDPSASQAASENGPTGTEVAEETASGAAEVTKEIDSSSSFWEKENGSVDNGARVQDIDDALRNAVK